MRLADILARWRQRFTENISEFGFVLPKLPELDYIPISASHFNSQISVGFLVFRVFPHSNVLERRAFSDHAPNSTGCINAAVISEKSPPLPL